MSLSQFFMQLSHTPALWVTSVLTLGVILVNGWTDAPNAIATCVVTRAMRPRPAILMAALCNFAGVLFMTIISPRVAETIFHMVDFGSDARAAQIALSASFSLPTSIAPPLKARQTPSSGAPYSTASVVSSTASRRISSFSSQP